MAGRSSVRLGDKGAEDVLLEWFRECDNDVEVDENVTANSDDSEEEDLTEVQSEYDSENTSAAEPVSANSEKQQLNFLM